MRIIAASPSTCPANLDVCSSSINQWRSSRTGSREKRAITKNPKSPAPSLGPRKRYAIPPTMLCTLNSAARPCQLRHSQSVAPTTRSSNSRPANAVASTSSTVPPLRKVPIPIGYGTTDVLRRGGVEVTVASFEPEQLEVETSGGIRLVADTYIGCCSCETFDLVALPNCRLQAGKNDTRRALKSVHSVDYRNILHLPFSKKSSVSKNETDVDAHILTFNMQSSDLMKFMLLFGSLSLQAAQPALAAAGIAGNLQLADFLGDLSDITTGFASAFLLIFFSELGDKTFFIAALLAARNSSAVVFTGTFGALTVMTVISVFLGRTFHYIDGILPFRLGQNDLPIDDIAAVCLLVYFGVSTLIDAASNDGLKGEDEQKEAELAVSKFSGNGAGILSAAGTVVSTFVLVFVAEWGDKSFFSTVALAAASSPLGVIGGSLAGHGVATLIAVLGGSLLGTFLSEKVIAYTGGVLFLAFAGITLIEIITG